MENSEKISIEFYENFGLKGLSGLVTVYRAVDDIRLVQQLSKKGDKILDLACGYGRVTIPVANAGYDITGIDIAPNLVAEAKKQAKKQGLKIRFDLGSMALLPYESESFDKIFCLWYSFNHLLTSQEQIRALNEMHRVLRPGGLAFIDLLNAEKKCLVARVEKEGRGADKRLVEGIFNGIKGIDYMHTRETVKNICEGSAFRRFRVGFGNFNKQRRIIAKLYR